MKFKKLFWAGITILSVSAIALADGDPPIGNFWEWLQKLLGGG